MLKNQRFVLTLVVVSASFVPAANAMAGIESNHNETLLRDDLSGPRAAREEVDRLDRLGGELAPSGRHRGSRAGLPRRARPRRAAPGARGPHDGAGRNNLAVLLKYLGRFDEAAALYERSLEDLEATLGPTIPRSRPCCTTSAGWPTRPVGRAPARPRLAGPSTSVRPRSARPSRHRRRPRRARGDPRRHRPPPRGARTARAGTGGLRARLGPRALRGRRDAWKPRHHRRTPRTARTRRATPPPRARDQRAMARPRPPRTRPNARDARRHLPTARRRSQRRPTLRTRPRAPGRPRRGRPPPHRDVEGQRGRPRRRSRSLHSHPTSPTLRTKQQACTQPRLQAATGKPRRCRVRSRNETLAARPNAIFRGRSRSLPLVASKQQRDRVDAGGDPEASAAPPGSAQVATATPDDGISGASDVQRAARPRLLVGNDEVPTGGLSDRAIRSSSRPSRRLS